MHGRTMDFLEHVDAGAGSLHPIFFPSCGATRRRRQGAGDRKGDNEAGPWNVGQTVFTWNSSSVRTSVLRFPRNGQQSTSLHLAN